jgi:predicted ATPase/DNA-binding NarL/FixJ family response regulator
MSRLLAPRLPIPATPLVGREREAALALALLRRPHVRLLTITGPGGIGKTRLSLRVASDLAGDYADGVSFIPLASVPDASLVAASLADALGVQEAADGSVRDNLTAALRESETLLVLDNFEHLLAAAPLLTALLESCPGLRFLVTSRTLLRVAGEHALPAPPLALPDTDRSLECLTESPAVRLFADRAQAVRPSFELTERTAPLVAEICRRLDGVPLAIELAAARVTHLSLSSLRERLEQRLPLLTGGPRDWPDRHRTLRDAIAWSHDLLSPDEQTLFRRLAVFAGGFAVEEAEALATRMAEPRPEPPDSVLAGIAALVDASLVQYELDASGTTRYRMLETIREFAAEQLSAAGDDEAAHRAHAAVYLAFAEQRSSSPFLPDDKNQLLSLEVEYANLRAALTRLAASGEPAKFTRLAVAVGWFWFVRGHLSDGRAWLELAAARDLTAVDRIKLGVVLGLIAMEQGDLDRAEHVMDAGLAAARESGNAYDVVQALVVRGALSTVQGAFEAATVLLEECVSLAESLPDPQLALAFASAARANLGVALLGLGLPEQASAQHTEALAGQRAVGNAWGELLSVADLADVALSQGDDRRAAAFYRESLAMAHDYGEQRMIADCLEGLATAEVAQQPRFAVRLLATAERLREMTGITARGLVDRAAFERGLATSHAALNEDDFAAAWAEGRALPLAKAVVEAIEPVSAPEPAAPPSGPFTPREMEILRLLVTGLPDRAIADALFLSVRTVENHVNHIFAKLHVRTRTAAASAAIAAGFVDPGPPPSA